MFTPASLAVAPFHNHRNGAPEARGGGGSWEGGGSSAPGQSSTLTPPRVSELIRAAALGKEKPSHRFSAAPPQLSRGSRSRPAGAVQAWKSPGGSKQPPLQTDGALVELNVAESRICRTFNQLSNVLLRCFSLIKYYKYLFNPKDS